MAALALIIILLVAVGCGQPDATDTDARLLRAATRGDLVALTAALEAGAGIEARDEHRRTALMLAVTADRVDVARVLVARGADVNALDDRHDTPFLVTGVTGSVAMLRVLLPGRPDTRIRNRFGGVAAELVEIDPHQPSSWSRTKRSSTRTPNPVAPLSQVAPGLAAQTMPAMSRCAQGVPLSTKR